MPETLSQNAKMNRRQALEELQQIAEWERSGVRSVELLALKCRHDFSLFCKFVTSGRFKPFKIHNLTTRTLQQVANGDIKRLMLSCPPRSGKSFLSSQLLPAWQQGRSPMSQNIMASYGLKLSRENAEAVLAIMNEERYKLVFPEIRLKSAEKISEIRNRRGGIIRIASVRANVTGLGFGVLEADEFPGLVILDDLLADGYSKSIKESTWNWLVTQLLTRALPNAGYLMIGTRFADDDMHARLLETQGELWQQLNIPALAIHGPSQDPLGRRVGESHWSEYFPVKKLQEIRSADERSFSCLYQGIPTNAETGLFASEHFSYCEHATLPRMSFTFAAVDTATSSNEQADESVMAIFGVDASRNLYLINLIAGKYDFGDLTEVVRMHSRNYSIRTLIIEKTPTGKALGDSLKKPLAGVNIEYVVAAKDKFSRASQVLYTVRGPRFKVSRGIIDWDETLKQFVEFPYGKDDRVDAIVYGIAHWQNNYQPSAPTDISPASYRIRRG